MSEADDGRCQCLAEDTTGKVAAGVLPCGHTVWVVPKPYEGWCDEALIERCLLLESERDRAREECGWAKRLYESSSRSNSRYLGYLVRIKKALVENGWATEDECASLEMGAYIPPAEAGGQPLCDACHKSIPYGQHVTTRQGNQFDQACWASSSIEQATEQQPKEGGQP